MSTHFLLLAIFLPPQHGQQDKQEEEKVSGSLVKIHFVADKRRCLTQIREIVVVGWSQQECRIMHPINNLLADSGKSASDDGFRFFH